MRNSFVLLIALLCITATPEVLAQASNPPQREQSNQERVLENLLNEVRELRTILKRIDTHTFHTQITINRLRVRQEQVLQLTREIFEVREKLVETKTRQEKLKDKIPELVKAYKSGLSSDASVEEAKKELEGLTQLELNLIDRETQLSADLDAARSSLNDLNNRLDALEREITTND
jgi:chromosome segregation ATPase